MTTDLKPTRRRFQFSLRTLLVVVTLCAIPCSWLGMKMRQAKRTRELVAAIEESGGIVVWSQTSGPVWLRSRLEDGLITDVSEVKWRCSAVLCHLEPFYGCPLHSADVLQHLKELPRLEKLSVGGDVVTDDVMEMLMELNQLKSLTLIGTKITDGGLESLNGLTQLQVLNIHGTKVTDEGVKKLQQALPNCQIIR